MSKPKLSILCGTYKNPELLIPTFDGIRKQTYKDFVMYLIDDNQPDEKDIIARTKEIVKEYRDLNIKYIKNDVNIGVPHVYRKWINLVDTEYFFLCGAGDQLLPHALENLVTFLKKNPNSSMVHGLEFKPKMRKDKPLFINSGEYDSFLYLKSHLNGFSKNKYGWSQASAVFRTELFKTWNIPVKPFHFWDHYFHCSYLLNSKKIGYINDYLAIRHKDLNEPQLRRISDFLNKIERHSQSLNFISEHTTRLISKKHNVYKYVLNTKAKMFISILKNNVSNIESLYCLEKIFNSNVLFPLYFILNILLIPIRKAIHVLRIAKRKIF